MALSVFVHLELQHFLLRDIIRDHPPGGTLGGQLGQVEVGGVLGDIVLLQDINQLRERRGDPDALLILDALIALAERLFNDDGQVFLFLGISGLAQVHKDGDKRRLAVGCHQRDDLVLNRLHAALDLITQPVLDDF